MSRCRDVVAFSLVYVAYSWQVKDASAKMSLSTVALFNANASWSASKP
jgi:CreA protein